MNARILVALLVGLAAGAAAGYLLKPGPEDRPPPPDATAALESLLAYRGQGAPAARRTIEWVDRIVEGGPPMLARLDEELDRAPARAYELSYQIGFNEGILSGFPTLRAALIEAAGRIGGDPAVEMLIEEANRPSLDPDAWRERSFAVLYLRRFAAEREEVREFYAERLRAHLARKTAGAPLHQELLVMRPFLPKDVYDPVATAFAAGWPDPDSLDAMAETLGTIDPSGAGRLFLDLLGAPRNPPPVREASARALGRMTAMHENAVRVLAAGSNHSYVLEFLKGLSYSRFGEIAEERAARESGSLDRMIEYVQGRKADLERRLDTVDALFAALPAEVVERLQPSVVRSAFDGHLRIADARLAELKAAKEAGGR